MLYLTFQGVKGFEMKIDRALFLAQYLTRKIKARDGFELVIEVSGMVNMFVHHTFELVIHIINTVE